MAQPIVQTHLARKWRSKTFSQMVGQELAVRILQNSLFKNYFFPVYLFAGQRGCGKTSAARLFAAALNCAQLETFQKDPRSCSMPCLQCPSCQAMSQSNHPDFIEIDAASHTGVDNVRQIIEAASLMPVLGHKKVYLIDEAHMLSKAAFNAFLKILEEPPANVVFMLATTDPHKIIETVRSRCFQLFFGPIQAEHLQKHLIFICQEEGISADNDALYTIVHETGGSARDALNLLEQVRFAHQHVTQAAVQEVLGHAPEQALLALAAAIINQGAAATLQQYKQLSLDTYASMQVWQKLTALIKAMVYIQYDVPVTGVHDQQTVHAIAQQTSAQHLITILNRLYAYEQLLAKSSAQADLFEVMILELAEQNQTVPSPSKPHAPEIVKREKTVQTQVTQTPASEPVSLAFHDAPTVEPAQHSVWHTFVEHIEQLHDPLLLSIVKQAQYEKVTEDHQVHVLFTKQSTFFGQWLMQTKTIWQPLLEAVFGEKADLHARFEKLQTESPKPSPARTPVPPAPTSYVRPAITPPQTKQTNTSSPEKRFTKKTVQTSAPLLPTVAIDIQDKTKWPKAHQLLEQFGGTISELKKDIPYAE